MDQRARTGPELGAGARSIWAKTSKAETWLSLAKHLDDAAHVGFLLWETWLPDRVRSQLCRLAGLSDFEVQNLVAWLSGTHDIGKASPHFAVKGEFQIPGVLDRMRDLGLSWPRLSSPRLIPHATLSQVFLRDWLITAQGMPRISANALASVVGAHHGDAASRSDLRAAALSLEADGGAAWQAARRDLLEVTTATWSATSVLGELGGRSEPLPLSAQLLLSGLVIVADWLASNEELFPHADRSSSRERAARALEMVDLAAPWAPRPGSATPQSLLDTRFPSLDGATVRPVQAELVGLARQVTEPPLIIVEADMGVGKTEGALLAAEILAERFGCGGVFIGLPTMATANPMFVRTLKWLDDLHVDTSVNLAHSKAGLNDDYRGLLRRCAWRGQIYDEPTDDKVAPRDGAARVVQWLRGRKKSTLANHVVGTIDQSLFLALRAKHVALRHLALAGKVVVIDEVHAADHYMRQYLRRVLVWLAAYGTPTILMTATLPPEQRDEYLAAWANGRRDPAPLPTARDDLCPRLTAYDSSVIAASPLQPPDGRSVRLVPLGDDPRTLIETLRKALVNGGCAGVICNTVTRAQQAAEALEAAFPGEVTLAHSRFIAPHRFAIESELLRRLGRSGDRPHRLIVVGTQVLEQSLDVDFDLMVTDLAPVDLVLQRIGRLHRHQRAQRPPRVRAAVCWVRGCDWSTTPPKAVPGASAVYGEDRLLRSAAVLAIHSGPRDVRLPSDIPRLVRVGYDPCFPGPTGWEPAWTRAEECDSRERHELFSRAQAFLLGEPRRADLNSLFEVTDPVDPELAAERGRSQVRDSGESLEVIALWRDGLDLRLPEGVGPHSGALVPEGRPIGDPSVERAMAACTLPLPPAMCKPWALDRVIRALETGLDYSGWQNSPWIAGQLVLAFDGSGRASIDNFEVSYTREGGLRVVQPAR